MKVTVLPATPDRWPDVEAIFSARGCSVARGCWCMFYRRSGTGQPLPSGHEPRQSQPRRLKALVDAGKSPGLIAYRGKVPIGWVSLAPRDEFAKLRRSPVMKPVDDKPVWSIVCFVCQPSTGARVWRVLCFRGAITYARKHGAALIEAYPVDKADRSKDDAIWFGAKSMYDHAGFKEVARRKPTRPVVRARGQRACEQTWVAR